jgi:hypothetical protein
MFDMNAEDIVKRLADWSRKYPRGRVYPVSKMSMDDELIEIEKAAVAFMEKKESEPCRCDHFRVKIKNNYQERYAKHTCVDCGKETYYDI